MDPNEPVEEVVVTPPVVPTAGDGLQGAEQSAPDVAPPEAPAEPFAMPEDGAAEFTAAKVSVYTDTTKTVGSGRKKREVTTRKLSAEFDGDAAAELLKKAAEAAGVPSATGVSVDLVAATLHVKGAPGARYEQFFYPQTDEAYAAFVEAMS